MSKKADTTVLATAKERFKQLVSVQGPNRDEALVDLKMLMGGEDQWDKAARDARKGRPMLTINKLPKFLKQVTGDQRQNRPSIKVRPVDSKADIQIAQILEGFIRNIEYQSNAPLAYDTAFKFAVAAGFPGYWRVLTDYSSDDTFDQDIVIEPIRNPLCVYMDHNCVPYRGKERFAFVCEMLSHEEFKAQYPNATVTDFEAAASGDDAMQDWHEGKHVRVAEYFYKESCKRTIYLLESGEVVEAEKVKQALVEQGGQKFIQFGQTPEMGAEFVRVVKERTTDSHKIMWCKMTGAEVLDGPREWSGRYIPIIPVFPEEFILEGKTYWKGLIRDARDSQRLYNYVASANVEAIALSPKSPFLLTTDMIQGHEAQWRQAHTQPFPYLLVNQSPNGLPRRAEPVMQQPGLIQTLLHSNDDMKDTTGIYDSMLGAQSNETSGRAILARQKEGDTGTFEYHDNLSRAIEHTGRVLVDLIPRIYDTDREIRLLNPDESESFVPINRTMQGPNGEAILINDISVGKYDVAVTVGPAYATQRQEAAEALTQIIQAIAPVAPPAVPIILPRLFRMMDWPEADDIAEELQQVFQQMMQPRPQLPPPGMPGGGSEMPQEMPPEMMGMMNPPPG